MDGVREWLDHWNHVMQTGDGERAKRVKQKLDSCLKAIENPDTQLYYELLSARYEIMLGNDKKASRLLAQVKPKMLNASAKHRYHYLFFSGMLATFTGRIQEAKRFFKEMENYCDAFRDDREIAELAYHKAVYYYQIQKPRMVLRLLSQIKPFYTENDEYWNKLACCENLHGLVCLSLKKYEQAEAFFQKAIEILEKYGVQSPAFIYNNLGYLYAEQNSHQEAIKYLETAVQMETEKYKSLYLLAREHFKLGNKERAAFFIEKGLVVCQETENEEYRHHFSILNAQNNHAYNADLEKVVNEGLAYFMKEGLTAYVREYTELMAARYYQGNQHEKASRYFNMAYEMWMNFEGGHQT
ncbi:tetratricopeptide repeat protein [Camelliibacillus cellulosilyticus]|uniref:Tetratricopeptide repeat protein n=1 Tax=Camelliibacillus cellulosilyticus TaxID=2174486 RepID=A0ABV9GR42_9BACL